MLTLDLPAIIAIYNHEGLHGAATFDIVPPTLEGRGGEVDLLDLHLDG